MLLLGIDFETQDDKPTTTNVTEVGASLWGCPSDGSGNIQEKHFTKIEGFSELIYDKAYPPQTEKILEITGITDQMLSEKGLPIHDVFVNQLLPLVHKADVIFAHKTAFDKTIFYAQCKKIGLVPPERTWICTLTEFNWPKKLTCHKLSHLAYEHSIYVDPATLHRAENDCDLMMKLITEKYNIKDIISYAAEPWVYLKADCAGPWVDGGVQTGIAKGLGFGWERCKGTDSPTWPKKWVGRWKEREISSIRTSIDRCVSPFRVDQVEGV